MINKIILYISIVFLGAFPHLLSAQQNLITINGLKLRAPSECAVLDEKNIILMCIKNNTVTNLSLKTGDDFEKNVVMSDKYDKKVEKFSYGTFVAIKLGKNHFNLFHLNDSNIVITGDSKDFILYFARNILVGNYSGGE